MTAPLSCGYVKGVTIKLGLQIPNFSYGTGVGELFPTVIAQAREAEAAGYDSVFVMDHFYQLPGLGTPDQPMLEAYTALGALATATERVQLGTLVTGNTYRNPTLLAKAITTLDVISAGRAILGIGTGWFELEHDSLGYDFVTFTVRFNRLYEELEIIYGHVDSTNTVFNAVGTALNTLQAPMTGADVDTSDPSQWGKLVRRSVNGKNLLFERDLGNGSKIFTFVLLAN